MTVKSVNIKHGGLAAVLHGGLGYATVQDTHGGQDINIALPPELYELVNWWKVWGPVFKSNDPRVIDAVMQAKTMHALTKEQTNEQYSWEHVTL